MNQDRGLVNLSVAVLWLFAACVSETRERTIAQRSAAVSAKKAETPRTCLPGHYALELHDGAKACPEAGAGWRVLPQRVATTQQAGAAASADSVAACSYTWIADGEAPALEATIPGAQLICFDEPPPSAASVELACPRIRQIGYRPKNHADCSALEAAGFHGEPLFPTHTDGVLSRYCRFIEREDPSAAERAQELPGWVHTECSVVSEHATADERLAMEQTYLNAVEAAASLPLLADGTRPEPVEVAVLDSAFDPRDDGLPGVGRLPHGRAVAVTIGRLACPERDAEHTCAVDIRNWLALWYERTPAGGVARNDRGGSFGTPADLATALVAAVDAATPGRRLVINISLAWTKVWGGEEPKDSDFAPEVRAAFHALQYARCRGALVIAAAGNTQGTEQVPIGPRFPAAWSARPAPSAQRCAELGVHGVAEPSGPLLYAASGLDNHDLPLLNTPIRGRAALAAPAWLAIVADPISNEHEPGGGLTGSSMAAAATSAAASVLWAYHPELRSDDVMRGIYDSAVDLGVPADFCLEGGRRCPNQHRVSLCAAAKLACADGHCEAEPACTAAGVPRSTADALHDATSYLRQARCPSSNAPDCAGAARSTTDRDLWGLGPLLEPQPENPICRACSGSFPGGWTLNLSIDSNPNNVDYWFWLDTVYVQDAAGIIWLDTRPLSLSFPAGTYAGGTISPLPRAIEYPVSVAMGIYWYEYAGPFGWYEGGQLEPIQVQ